MIYNLHVVQNYSWFAEFNTTTYESNICIVLYAKVMKHKYEACMHDY